MSSEIKEILRVTHTLHGDEKNAIFMKTQHIVLSFA
jgi:hypothetical protein